MLWKPHNDERKVKGGLGTPNTSSVPEDTARQEITRRTSTPPAGATATEGSRKNSGWAERTAWASKSRNGGTGHENGMKNITLAAHMAPSGGQALRRGEPLWVDVSRWQPFTSMVACYSRFTSYFFDSRSRLPMGSPRYRVYAKGPRGMERWRWATTSRDSQVQESTWVKRAVRGMGNGSDAIRHKNVSMGKITRGDLQHESPKACCIQRTSLAPCFRASVALERSTSR